MFCFLHIGKCLKRVQSSPFELLNGRSVSRPMTIINELWAQDEVKTTYQYAFDLKEKLERSCELARGNLHKSSARYKAA